MESDERYRSRIQQAPELVEFDIDFTWYQDRSSEARLATISANVQAAVEEYRLWLQVNSRAVHSNLGVAANGSAPQSALRRLAEDPDFDVAQAAKENMKDD